MDGQKKICGGLFAHKMSIKNRFRINGSASQLNKLVLKDSPYVQKLSGTHLYPRSRINTYINFPKPLPRADAATTRGSQPLVLLPTTRGI